MKFKRCLAVLAAVAMTVGCNSCALGDSIMKKLLGIEPYELTEEQQAQRFDVEGMQSRAEEMSHTWTQVDKDDQLREDIEWMIGQFDAAAEVYFTNELVYYADWENSSVEAMYNQTYEDYYVANEILYWTLINGYHKSLYDEIFGEYLGDIADDQSYKEYYTTNSLEKIMRYGQSDSAYYSGALQDYYDVSGDVSVDADDADLQCAEMYLENLKTYDCSQYLYDYYVRDYEAADASALYAQMITELQPLYDELYALVVEHPQYDHLYTDVLEENDLFDTVREYAARISPNLAASAQKLVDEQWYTIGTGDQCYTGSYCISIPGKEKALIYVYQNHDFYDFSSAVHEFGHFHADWHDNISMFYQVQCTDIAEVQSQGLSMLYTAFYDELFGENAEYLEMVTLFDIVDSIVCGLAVGEFEYRVMERLDDITAEEVVELFYEINNAANTGYILKDISHLYEQPGYYVSYAISAIPAMQIYITMQDDFDEAIKMYESIAGISSNDGKYEINGAMKVCGFDDIFAPTTMTAIADEVRTLIDASQS